MSIKEGDDYEKLEDKYQFYSNLHFKKIKS